MKMKYAMDCEMVGCGNSSILARVSIVDENRRVVLDTYVRPRSHVTDYRTAIHGIRSCDLNSGKEFFSVVQNVKGILIGNLLVGHSLKYDLDVLELKQFVNCENIRDLAECCLFQSDGKPVSLKDLAFKHLGRVIQKNKHDSVEDALAAMDIYLKYANQWEKN